MKINKALEILQDIVDDYDRTAIAAEGEEALCVLRDHIKKIDNDNICHCTRCESARAGHYVKGIDDYYREDSDEKENYGQKEKS